MNVPINVERRDDGVYVATTAVYPDLRAEADSQDGAAGELAMLIRDALVRETGSSRGIVRSLTRIETD